MHKILILYYSRTGGVAELARHIATGAERVEDCESILRTVPAVSNVCEAVEDSVPSRGDAFATLSELETCDALIIGSPTRFGAMASPLKYFMEQTAGLWQAGALCGKPCGVFTSSGSMHGGQESTLLSMLGPLLHHGMIAVGIPYYRTALGETTRGGAPYGAGHVSGERGDIPLHADEKSLAETLGRRVAECAVALKNSTLQKAALQQ